MKTYKDGLQEAISILEEFIDENTNGLAIEKLAKNYAVPDSIAAVRLFELVVLERLKEKSASILIY